mgnify:FL=1
MISTFFQSIGAWCAKAKEYILELIIHLNAFEWRIELRTIDGQLLWIQIYRLLLLLLLLL